MEAVLWHIRISHYSEKVRWALDLKDVPNERRSPAPGAHMAIALWHSRGTRVTFPILRLDGRTYSDSTEIIAALEERYPEPPLYPPEPGDRRRALELEEFFDEEAGPYARLYAFHELRSDPEGSRQFVVGVMPEWLVARERPRALVARAAGGFARVRYGVAPEQAAAEARAKIVAAIGRVESELEAGEGTYMVGDALTVADITAASLLAPIVQPPTGPRYPDPAGGVAELRDELRGRRGWTWVEEMFRCHRQNPRRP